MKLWCWREGDFVQELADRGSIKEAVPVGITVSCEGVRHTFPDATDFVQVNNSLRVRRDRKTLAVFSAWSWVKNHDPVKEIGDDG